MAIKRSCKFALGLVGDGTSTTFNAVIVGSPIWFTPVAEGQMLQQNFELATLKPTDVIDVTSSNLPSVSSAAITTLGTILQVVFSSAPTDGVYGVVFGTFVF